LILLIRSSLPDLSLWSSLEPSGPPVGRVVVSVATEVLATRVCPSSELIDWI
jgi:hypothetical protein